MRALALPRIMFNYLGQFDASFDDDEALFVPAKESSGQERSPLAEPAAWLDINGQVYDGMLSLGWSFDAAIYRRETVEQLADLYRQALIEVIEHCIGGASGVTPSDFALVRLSQGDLDRLPVPARAIEDIYPLTPMQQGMLFHSLYEPEAGVYVTQLSVDVEGLSPDRFRVAWQAVLDRYEILRTGFVWGGSFPEPIQVVQRSVELPVYEHDLRGVEGVDARLEELRAGEHARGFDLARPPLFRVVLARVDERRHHLIWTSHHLLLDGWSRAQLIEEVIQHYAGLGRPAALLGRYRDYIAWLKDQSVEASERFWREQLQAIEADAPGGGAVAPSAERWTWGRASSLELGSDASDGGLRPAGARDHEHRRPGCLGAAAPALHREENRCFRCHRRRAARRARRRRDSPRALHQYLAGGADPGPQA